MAALVVFGVAFVWRSGLAVQDNSEFRPLTGGLYREGVVGQPIAVNPIISDNQIDADLSALIYSRLADLVAISEKSDDGLTYTLKLFDGLVWEDGESLTSDDVLFTIKRIQDPETNSPLFKNWRGLVVERISSLQLQISLPTPYAFFTDSLERLPIIPQHIFGNIPAENLALSEYNLEPVGSGSYRFKSFAKRKDGFVTEYRLERNPRNVATSSHIGEIHFKFFETEADMLNAFRLREIDGFGSLTPLKESVAENRVKEKLLPLPQYYAVFLNPNINPSLKDRPLRQALNLAIDKERIIREVFHGQAFPVTGPVSEPDNLSASESDYDPETARTLIAGLTNKNTEFNLIVPQIDFLVKTAAIIKENWLAAGIVNINLIQLEVEDLLENVIKPRNYEMLLFGNILENPRDLFPFWHSSQRFYPDLNLAAYNNTKFDAAIEKAREVDSSEEREIYLETAKLILAEDQPAVFLFSLPYTYIHRDVLKGFDATHLTSLESRFRGVASWFVREARVLK